MTIQSPDQIFWLDLNIEFVTWQIHVCACMCVCVVEHEWYRGEGGKTWWSCQVGDAGESVSYEVGGVGMAKYCSLYLVMLARHFLHCLWYRFHSHKVDLALHMCLGSSTHQVGVPQSMKCAISICEVHPVLLQKTFKLASTVMSDMYLRAGLLSFRRLCSFPPILAPHFGQVSCCIGLPH